LPTGTITFLFTDIEGSTPLWECDPAAMQKAVSRHRHHGILNAAAEARNGHVFKIVGDEFQISFELPSNWPNSGHSISLRRHFLVTFMFICSPPEKYR